MKQTNNAIKFLMAQYRAIFQNAYFKGLATAAVVTMGLAAGQAQAKATDTTFTQASEAKDTITIDGKQYETTEKEFYTKLAVTDNPDDPNAFANTTFKIAKGAISSADTKIAGAATGTTFKAKAITIDVGQNTATDHGLKVIATDGNATVQLTDLTVTKGTLDISATASGKSAKVEANTISVGETGTISISSDDTESSLGTKDTTYTLASGSTLSVGKKGSVLGNISNAEGVNIKFTEAGTLKAHGTNVKANIDVTAEKNGTIDLSATDSKTLSLSAGKITINGNGNSGTTGKLTVASGTILTLSSDVEVAGATADKGTLEIAKGATLNADTNQVGKFLNADANKGILTLTGTWNLNGSDTEAAELGGLAFGSNAGNITVADTSVINGDKIKVSKTVTGSASDLKINAKDLTLGNTEAKSAALLGGATATTKSLTLLTNEAKGYNLQDSVVLKNVNDSGDALTGGTISGNVILGTGSKSLTVAGGIYQYGGNISVGSEDANLEVKADANTNLSSLTLTGDLVLVRTKSKTGQVIAQGTDKDHVAVLDLQQANISLDESVNKRAVTIESDKFSTIKVKGQQLDSLFATATSGAILDIKSGGQLQIAEGVKLTNKQIASAQTDSGIKLATSGLVNVLGALEIETKTDNVINLGDDNSAAKLKAISIDVTNQDTDSATELQSGSFIITEALETDSTGFKIANKGVVQLGDFANVSGDIYTTEKTEGSFSDKVEVNGTDAKLNVLAGNWNASSADLTVTAGKLTVGQDDSGKKDANGDVIKSSLSVNKLTVTQATSGAEITKHGSLATTELDLSSGSINVSGALTVNGKYKAAVEAQGEQAAQDAEYGIKLKDDAIILGEGATLTFGKDVNYALGIGDVQDTVSTVEIKGGFDTAGSLTGAKFSTVKLTLDKNVKFDAQGLKSLNKALFGDTGTQGSISLGEATIDLSYTGTEEEPVLEWAGVTADQKLVLPFVEDDKSKKATIKLTGNGPNLGNFGSVQADGVAKGQQITVDNHGSLNSADTVNGQTNKLFAYNKNGEVLGLNISEKVNFKLVNGGEVGKITLGNNSSLLVDGGASNGKTIVESIKGTASDLTVAGDLDVTGKADLGKVVSKEGTSFNVGSNAEIADVAVLAGSTSVKGNLSTTKSFTSTGSLQVSGTSTFAGETKLAGNNTLLGNVAFNGKTTLEGQNTLGETTFQVSSSIAQGQTFAKEIKLSANTVELSVGQDEVKNTLPNGSTANLVADKLTLAGGTLFADPTFNLPRTIVVAGELTQLKPADKETDAGTLDGKAVALRNSIIALGVDTKDADGNAAYQASVDYVKNTFAPLFETDQSLQSDGIGAIAYVNKKLTMGTGKIVVDPTNGIDGYKKAYSDANSTAYKDKIDGNEIYLGTGAALAVDANALNNGAAISFDKATDASVYAEENAKVLVVGNGIQNKSLVLFENKQADVKLQGKDLAVESINGLFKGKFTVGQSMEGEVELSLDRVAVNKYLSAVSAPVQDTLLAAAYGMHNYEEYEAAKKNGTLAKFQEDSVLGNVAEGFKVVNNKGTYEVYYGDKVATAEQLKEFNIDKDTSIELAKKNADVKEHVVYVNTKNDLLDNILYYNGSAIDAETNARLAVFGGAPQAAIEAGASTYEAISARMGVGVSGVSAAANGQGGAIWVTPVYKSAESDGFNADNKSYGADVKLYGLALGADIEVAPNFKVGGMFNVGSGDADGQGLGSNVSNDFDYYGLGLYAGYSMDAFSLVADITYTAVDNDIEGNTDLGKVTTSIDSTNLSVGVTGQYKLTLAGMDVTPHAGLRYSMIDMDDYSTAYSQNDSDSLNIFSVPVGVTIAKEYVTDTWTVKPSFDLTLTGNFGDDEAEATAKWNGFSNLSTTVKSEIMDNFTYGAAVGVSATSGNFGLGLGVNYTGSSNTDEFGVNANARYMF